MSQLPRIPAQQRLLEETDTPVLMHPRWVQWLLAIVNAIQGSVGNVGQVDITAKAASITTVAVPVPSMPAGVHRISYTARITRAASVSSSLTVHLGWTDGGISCGQTFAAITGNTTATTQSGEVLVHLDAGTSATYSTVYASSGSPSMTYALSVVVEML